MKSLVSTGIPYLAGALLHELTRLAMPEPTRYTQSEVDRSYHTSYPLRRTASTLQQNTTPHKDPLEKTCRERIHASEPQHEELTEQEDPHPTRHDRCT